MTVRRGVVLALIACVALVVVWWLQGRATYETSPAGPASSGSATSAPRDVRATRVGQAARSGKRIAGIVIAPDGAPVRGASVRLGSALARVPTERTTDDHGRFDLGTQPIASYTIAAEASSRTGALLALDLRDPAPTMPADQLRLVLHRCDASIHGVVRDGAGGVIPGANLAPVTSSWPVGRGVDVADDGTYELCLPPGGASVLVTADGYATVAENVNVFGRTRRDFTLVPGTSIVGRVVRAGGGEPVADAVVSIRAADPRRGSFELSGVTDGDGRFAIEGVTPGRHALIAFAEGLATASPVEVVAEIGVAQSELVVELVGTHVVRGKVVETGSQAPIADARVVLKSDSGGRAALAYTSADGSFVAEVMTGSFEPWVDHHELVDEADATLTVEDADLEGVVIEVRRLGSIAGRVLHEGKPVHGARVRSRNEMGSTMAVSDVDGTFLLRGVREGTHRVYAQSELLGAFTHGPEIKLGQAEHRTGVDVMLDLSGSIAGTVVDQHDRPVAGAFVSFTLLRGTDYGAATTADDGTFTARALSGGGEYLFEVRQRDRSSPLYPPIIGKRHSPIEVKDGSTHLTGVRIRVRVDRLTITGRVLDANGRGLPDVSVRAERGVGGDAPATTTDEHGAFTLKDLGAGTYAIRASGARGDARVAGIRAGATGVELRLATPGAIEGTLAGFPGGAEVTAFRVSDYTLRLRGAVSGTSFRITNVPPGTWRVSARGPDASTSAKVIVEAGATAKVELRAPQTGSITGRFVDAKSRAPIAGAWCTAVSQGPEIDAMTMPARTRSDASGRFRLGRVMTGAVEIHCGTPASMGHASAAVVANRELDVEVLGAPFSITPSPTGTAGMTVDNKLGDAVVSSVTPEGPAAKAGIRVGDVIVQIDDMKIEQGRGMYATTWFDHVEVGTTVKLVLERGDKPYSVTLTFVAETK